MSKIEEIWSDEQRDFVLDLMNKASAVIEKSESSSNVNLSLDGYDVPVRVDDKQLFYLSMRLLPNIVNYLVNILPQFFYPYVVAYLQDLSTEDRKITISDLYNLVTELDFED